MVDDHEIREHMMVSSGEGILNGVRGRQIGTVDCIENGMMKLKLNNSLKIKYQMIPIFWVDSVDNQTVYLSKRFDNVMNDWSTAS